MEKLILVLMLSLGIISCRTSASITNQSSLPKGHLSDSLLINAFMYNIYTDNCHNVANAGVDTNPEGVGIVICSGYSDLVEDWTGHTYNYEIKYVDYQNVNVTFYNWGTTSTCKNVAYPLDVEDKCIKKNVNDFCYKSAADSVSSFDEGRQIRILPVGQKVEEPTEDKCSKQQSNYVDCMGCCDAHARYWIASHDMEGYKKYYKERVNQLAQAFGPGFVEYYRNRVSDLNGKAASSLGMVDFLKGLRSDVKESALLVMKEYLINERPDLLSPDDTDYSGQAEKFLESCQTYCSYKALTDRSYKLMEENNRCIIDVYYDYLYGR